MKDIEFLREILEMKAPWQVLNVSVDQRKKQIDIYIGFEGILKKTMFGFSVKKGLFGKGGKSTCPRCHTTLPQNDHLETFKVQHLAIADFTTYLHIPSPDTIKSPQSDCICMYSWAVTGTKCTQPMYNFVVDMLQKVSNYKKVAEITGVTDEELQNITEISGVKPTAVANDAAGSSLRVSSAGESGIPHFAHPSWQSLIAGNTSIKTSVFGLSLLLQRARAKYDKNPTLTTCIDEAKVLRQFFLRNKKLLKDEIAQLTNKSQRGKNEPVRVAAKNSNIPAESALVWKRIASGEQRLETHLIGLQLLLGRVLRKSQSPDQSAEDREADIRSICHFFIKHEKRLGKEIAQLGEKADASMG
jgi:hypothetical protein